MPISGVVLAPRVFRSAGHVLGILERPNQIREHTLGNDNGQGNLADVFCNHIGWCIYENINTKRAPISFLILVALYREDIVDAIFRDLVIDIV